MGALALIGGDSGYWDRHIYQPAVDAGFHGKTNAYFLGLAYELNATAPLTFSFDVMYGWMPGNDGIYNRERGTWNNEKEYNWDDNPASGGWFVDAALRYKLDWATAGIFGWWSSGDKANAYKDAKFGRLPELGVNPDTGFSPSSFGFAGAGGIGSDTAISSTGIGMWGIGAELADMSFLDRLTHTIRFAYYRGTNHPDNVKDYDGHNGRTWIDRYLGIYEIERTGRWSIASFGDRQYMTTSDQAFEINFDHKYQVNENLALGLELGWIHMDLDKDVWGNATREWDNVTEDAWKAQLWFQYKF